MSPHYFIIHVPQAPELIFDSLAESLEPIDRTLLASSLASASYGRCTSVEASLRHLCFGIRLRRACEECFQRNVDT